jgi:guanine nucleotide-binding protein G(i) subunit alpha
MVDPLSILGAAASIVGIIDCLSQSISTINDFRERWKDSDLTVLNLASQLTLLRAALRILSNDVDEVHHQLIMDLDGSIYCCKTLADEIELHLAQLKQPPNGALKLSAKVKVVFGTKSMDQMQKMIERQTSALTLLLAACNW